MKCLPDYSLHLKTVFMKYLILFIMIFCSSIYGQTTKKEYASFDTTVCFGCHIKGEDIPFQKYTFTPDSRFTSYVYNCDICNIQVGQGEYFILEHQLVLVYDKASDAHEILNKYPSTTPNSLIRIKINTKNKVPPTFINLKLQIKSEDLTYKKTVFLDELTKNKDGSFLLNLPKQQSPIEIHLVSSLDNVLQYSFTITPDANIDLVLNIELKEHELIQNTIKRIALAKNSKSYIKLKSYKPKNLLNNPIPKKLKKVRLESLPN